MAVVRSHQACSSTCYDVFLSFRGEDTRKTFTDHLYTALVQQGFRTFRDDDEVKKGEYLKSELEKAISQSKMSIVVISKNYTSSTWCLDELVMILERRRNSKHKVLPLFYNVDPSDVRKQTGRIAKAFDRYEKQFESETDQETKLKSMEKIKGWRSALTEIADLIGLDLRNEVDGHEAKFIQKIIKVIVDKLRPTTLDIAPYEIGIDTQAESINMWVQDESTGVSVRAICGMGGIGKTTIAKFVYNQNSDSFNGSSFLANIREVSEQPNGLLCLQRQLLSDISKTKHKKIHNVDEGLAMIKNLVRSKKVLLVLDDVEQADQIYVVLGMQDWLFPGSKVIITTRHERLLKPHQIFRVEKMGEDKSIKLFSLHAFGKDCPPESYIEHTKRVIKICEGLPLALKVVGSSLSGKSEDEWVSELAKLEAIPHSQILKKLKINYDSLQDDCDKRLFLHIACFFVGTNKDYAIKILEKCNLHAKIGIQNLIDRCLLERDSHAVLKMHRLIQDMGREIIKQESHEAGERSRVWHHGDAFRVLKSETGTKAVEGLTLDMHMLKEAGNNEKKRRYEEFLDKSRLRKHASLLKRRCLSFVSGQSVSTCYTTLTSPNDIYLRTDAFKSMTNLRLLKLNYVQLTGSYESFPKSLVWLSWHGFPFKTSPVEFRLENLVALDLRHSRLEQVWKETPFLESLKILDLSYSEWLQRTPNFLGVPNLERLILKGCVRLVQVCESIGNLEKLDLLDLSDCRTLRKLPRNIGKLGSLKTLVISGCNIGEFPSEMREMNSLEVLNADGIALSPLHSSSGAVRWWQRIVWSMVSTPRKSPKTLWTSLPQSLKQLSLSECNLSDDSFPENICNLPSLFCLNLSKNPFRRLPNCFKSLSGLKYLYVTECHRLQSLELNGLAIDSGLIVAENCRSLENVMSPNGSVDLWLNGSYKLVELEDCFKIEPTTKLRITHTTNAARYPIEGLFEYGIYSLFFERGEIPKLFSGEKCEGSSIYFTVPSLPSHRIQYLYVWCVIQRIEFTKRALLVSVTIENTTKDISWIYRPQNLPYMEYLEWLSRWRFGNQLEAGDEISITFDLEGGDVFKIENDEVLEIKECGFKIVYRDPQEEEENRSTSTTEKSHHNFPALWLSSRTYFLCHIFEYDPDEDAWF